MKLRNLVFIFLATVLFQIGECNLFGITQRVIVRGQLLCGEAPAKNVLVKLYDKDIGKDDLMARGKTDNEGYFLLNGTESEMGNIDPMLNIYHDCNDGLPCSRKWKWMIPNSYITRKNEQKIVDIGVWNLEVIMRKEHRDCVH